jgi:hypothetical protein
VVVVKLPRALAYISLHGVFLHDGLRFRKLCTGYGRLLGVSDFITNGQEISVITMAAVFFSQVSWSGYCLRCYYIDPLMFHTMQEEEIFLMGFSLHMQNPSRIALHKDNIAGVWCCYWTESGGAAARTSPDVSHKYVDASEMKHDRYIICYDYSATNL